MFFVRLLGGVSLEGPSGPLTGRVVQRRRLALLALLAAEGGKGCSRDKLVGYLWPESDETTARRLLSDSLYVVRQALGEGCVLTSGELVRLNPEVVRTDLVDFERALEAEDLQRAVELYGGPFLEGFHSGAAAEFDHWRDSESRRLADLYAGALESLARAAEESGDSARAVVWWKRLAAHDPHNSRPALRLAEAMAAAGDRANALEYALQHERLLRDELGIEPDADFLALRERLKEGGTTKLALSREVPTPAREPAAAPEPEAQEPGIEQVASVEEGGRRQLLTRRNAFRRVAVTVVLSSAAVVSWLVFRGLEGGGGRSADVSVALDRVAVFPFSYQGSEEYADLGDGIVHLLSFTLDGAGDLRAVDPRAVLAVSYRDEYSRLDPERAGGIAERLGAGRYIVGHISEVEGRLRITAWLYESAGSVARAAVEGSSGELYRLVDDLTAQLAVGVIGEGGARLVGIAVTTTDSLEALKAYLEGESDFRARRFAAGSRALRRAVQIDSTFALAWYCLAGAAEFASEWDLAHEAAGRAVRYIHRLPPREQLLVEALSAHMRGDADESERVYRVLLQRYPDDVEGWYGLGALLYHQNLLRGRSLSEVGEPFARVLDYEPNHDRARALLMYAEAAEGRWVTFDSLARALVPDIPLSWRAALAYANDDRLSKEQALAEAEAATDMEKHFTATLVAWSAPDPHDAVDLAHILARESTESPELRALGLVMVSHLELAGGRRRLALAALDSLEYLQPAWALEYRALLLAAPFLEVKPGELRAVRDELTSWNAAAVPASNHPHFHVHVHNGVHTHLRLYLLGLLNARLGDHDAALRYAAELEELEAPHETGSVARDLAQGVRAQAAWDQGRPDEVLAALDAAPGRVRFERAWASPFYSQSRERYLRAQAFEALGRQQEALGWYATVSQHSVYDKIYLAPSHLRRAEIYERLGDRDKAALHYARFIELWADSDSEFQPQVEGARRALRSLSRER